MNSEIKKGILLGVIGSLVLGLGIILSFIVFKGYVRFEKQKETDKPLIQNKWDNVELADDFGQPLGLSVACYCDIDGIFNNALGEQQPLNGCLQFGLGFTSIWLYEYRAFDSKLRKGSYTVVIHKKDSTGNIEPKFGIFNADGETARLSYDDKETLSFLVKSEIRSLDITPYILKNVTDFEDFFKTEGVFTFAITHTPDVGIPSTYYFKVVRAIPKEVLDKITTIK